MLALPIPKVRGSGSTHTTSKTMGTYLHIDQHCSNCSYIYKWDSQPFVNNMPAVLSAAILFSGALPTKVLRVLKFFGCVTMNKRTFFMHQSKYLQPSIASVWKEHQTSILKQLRKEKRPLIIGGDGRADSPGHSAKFGAYTAIELKKKVVVDVQLVQVYILIVLLHRVLLY